MLGKHGYPFTIAFQVLQLPHLNLRVGSPSQVLHVDHGSLGHPVFAAVHDEKKHDVLLKMLSLPNNIQMWLKPPLQATQLSKLDNFLFMKTLMLQLNKLANLPHLLNKFSITKSN